MITTDVLKTGINEQKLPNVSFSIETKAVDQLGYFYNSPQSVSRTSYTPADGEWGRIMIYTWVTFGATYVTDNTSSGPCSIISSGDSGFRFAGEALYLRSGSTTYVKMLRTIAVASSQGTSAPSPILEISSGAIRFVSFSVYSAIGSNPSPPPTYRGSGEQIVLVAAVIKAT